MGRSRKKRALEVPTIGIEILKDEENRRWIGMYDKTTGLLIDYQQLFTNATPQMIQEAAKQVLEMFNAKAYEERKYTLDEVIFVDESKED